MRKSKVTKSAGILLAAMRLSTWGAWADASLRKNFQNPPNAAKPHTWWHWMNDYIDSYETGEQNWTQGFEGDFKQRMDYDIIAHLPALTGRVVNNLDYTERFLWDYRRVIADMWTENYWGHFAEMCHKTGLLLSTEPYGVPGNMDDFAVADAVDIPMGEWWARTSGGPFTRSSKLAASAAHTNGRRYVGAEAFTAGRMAAAFVNHPYGLKAQGDYFFCQGTNRFIFLTGNSHLRGLCGS